MRCGAGLGRARGRELSQVMRQRMREADMSDNAIAEERADPSASAIDELIGEHQVGRLVSLLQTPDGTRRQDPLNTKHLHAEDVGAVVQLARIQPMALAMTS